MKKIILFFFWVGFSLPVFALTLDQAIQSAVENSHDLKIQKLEAESAPWSEVKARAGFLPTLELEGRHLTNERFEELEVPFDGAVFIMPAIQPYTALGFTARWNLFNGFRSQNEVEAAHSERQAAEAQLQRGLEEKRVQIRTLYSRALASQILVNVADQNIESLQKHLSDVQARIRSGVSTRFDSLRTEVQLEEARTEKVAAENNVVTSRAQLFEAIGQADDGLALQGPLSTDFTKVDPARVSHQPENRKDRQALLSQTERQQRLAKAAKSHWMPSVSLFGNYEWYNNINHSITESDERFKSAYALGLQFSWNLFDGGADWADQKKSLIAQKIAEEKLAQFDQNLPTGVDDSRRHFQFNLINYNAKLSSVRKAEEAVRLAQGGLRAGTRTNTEILDAVVDLNRARAAAVKSQVEAIESWGQLELALGTTL